MKVYQNNGIIINDFKFSVVLESEVLEFLNDFNIYKSTGQDDISAIFVKDGAHTTNLYQQLVTYIGESPRQLQNSQSCTSL